MPQGTLIRELRKTQGLTLVQLASLSGTSVSYLSRVERGQVVPTEAWRQRITTALGRHMAGQDAA